MLQNAYFLAKIGVDTAENERDFAKICQKLATALRVQTQRAGSREAEELLHVVRDGNLAGSDPRAGKLDRARSRLYRSRILQENMRWKALAETYTMHACAPFSKHNILFENR